MANIVARPLASTLPLLYARQPKASHCPPHLIHTNQTSSPRCGASLYHYFFGFSRKVLIALGLFYLAALLTFHAFLQLAHVFQHHHLPFKSLSMSSHPSSLNPRAPHDPTDPESSNRHVHELKQMSMDYLPPAPLPLRHCDSP